MNAAPTGPVLDDAATGTIEIGGATVRRLGFGAMRVSGARNSDGVRDRDEAIRLYRRVYERGVNFIDVANIYGYGECEEILAAALHPYPDDLLIGTKAGFRPGKIEPGKRSLPPSGRPEHIRQECETSLRRLRVDRIDLYQVHVPDPDVPYEDTVGAFVDLQRAGKVRDIGISNVTLAHLTLAQSLCEVVSVQNAYNVARRGAEPVLAACEEQGIAFIPHSPNILGEGPGAGAVQRIADERGVSAQQVAVAWLLAHSPVMVPIPGTSKVDHADDNIDAAWLTLTGAERAALDGTVP
jgi:aryl-alcohol dehydrogenase-like predicted oxidoreductase